MEKLINYFTPEKYVLNLAIDKNAKTLGGEVTVFGKSTSENIKFHAVDLSIDEVAVNGENVSFEIRDGILTLFEVPKGDLMVRIGYHGSLNENMEGAYLSTYEYNGKTETIVATQFESHYAREAFPCIDEPAAKAIFELSIAVPDNSKDIVVSNMPEVGMVCGAGQNTGAQDADLFLGEKGLSGDYLKDFFGSQSVKTVSFESTPRMSTYLLAWVIGRFHGKTVKNQHGVEITTYCALNQELETVDFANEIAARSLEFYDDNFGVAYPLKRLLQVALPDFEAGAMENWGLVTYRESMMLAGKDATLATRKTVALTVAHELSHQWFGDLVTMEWWDDLWLNESFATIMEYFAVNVICPEYKIFETFFTSDACMALSRDAYSGVQSVHQVVKSPEEIATLFDPAIVYAKGARLMLMLVRLMGWTEFCKGLRDYFEKFKYENTVGDDLWEALEPYADFKPKELMHAFIDKPGYPVITNEVGNFEKFSQKRFLLDGPCVEESWPIPQIIEDMSGHYILNLTDDEFNKRLAIFNELGLEEKLRLLIDRELITKAGMRSAVGLVTLAPKFCDEDSAAVWNKIAAIIGDLKIYVDDGSEEEKLLKSYTLRLIDTKLNEVGLRTSKDDGENKIRLRANLLALDYFAEDKTRFAVLAGMYKDDYREMDAEIRSDILSAKIYLEPIIASEFIKKYVKITDPDVKFDYLEAATLVRDASEIKKITKLLGKGTEVKAQDQLYLFVWLYRNPLARARVFEWLTSNWETVKEIGGKASLDSYPTYVAKLARTKEELDRYVEFFGPMKDDPALRRAISIGEKEMKARLELIKKNSSKVVTSIEEWLT